MGIDTVPLKQSLEKRVKRPGAVHLEGMCHLMSLMYSKKHSAAALRGTWCLVFVFFFLELGTEPRKSTLFK